MKPDQDRLKNLLTDTVVLLCKNGLRFNKKLCIEGLVGVRVDDDDVFFIHISETAPTDEGLDSDSPESDGMTSSAAYDGETEEFDRPMKRVKVKQEEEDDDISIIENQDDVFPVQLHSQQGFINDRVPPLHGRPDYNIMPHNARHAGNRETLHAGASPYTKLGSRSSKFIHQSATNPCGELNSNLGMKNFDAATWGQVKSPGVHQLPVATWPADQNLEGGNSTVEPENAAEIAQMLASLTKPRRQAFQNVDGRFVCNYPGCTQSFAHRPNLYRHQKYAGHRANKQRAITEKLVVMAPSQSQQVWALQNQLLTSTSAHQQLIHTAVQQEPTHSDITVKTETGKSSDKHFPSPEFVTRAEEEQQRQQAQLQRQQQRVTENEEQVDEQELLFHGEAKDLEDDLTETSELF